MLDLHNKLMFPVIRWFRGTVTKTIGDSIMASFKSPEDALRAAIGMQQMLKKRKKEDKDLDIKIRIGMHTCQAIVEKGDVYAGDPIFQMPWYRKYVSLGGSHRYSIDSEAQRAFTNSIEKMGKADEILVTSATSRWLTGK